MSSKSVIVPEGSTATLTALVREAREISHSAAKTLIAAGFVAVDRRLVHDPALRPAPGSRISIRETKGGLPAAPKRPLAGPGFRVLHLDRTIIVVEKETMIVTIPVPDEDPRDPSLVARVSAALALAGHHIKQLWVVHRIDRETSGLVLFARSEAAANKLRDQFRARSPRREYLAWTEGIPDPPQGRLHHRLHEDEESRRMLIAAKGTPGKDAELTYVVEETAFGKNPRARVRVKLVTGRRNQIRVQFAAEGWPLLGDRFYGARDRGCGRTALHAAVLGFTHPTTKRPLSFECPLPKDLRSLDREIFRPKTPRKPAAAPPPRPPAPRDSTRKAR